jgi:hypothetical protein
VSSTAPPPSQGSHCNLPPGAKSAKLIGLACGGGAPAAAVSTIGPALRLPVIRPGRSYSEARAVAATISP